MDRPGFLAGAAAVAGATAAAAAALFLASSHAPPATGGAAGARASGAPNFAEGDAPELVHVHVALRAELGALRLKAMRQRAAAEGVGEQAIDHALEAEEDPKAALITLIVERANRRGGPEQRLVRALLGGGAAVLSTVSAALEHADEVLEQHLAYRRASRAARC